MKKQLFFLLLLLILPSVSASSFTGTFNDYGLDTGTDGLFNFLVINAQVNINKAKPHMIYGRLEDSEGNFIEFNDCKNIPTGTQNYEMRFKGTTLYRNQVNGPYNLRYAQLSSVDSCTGFGMPPDVEDSLFDAHDTQAYQYTQFQTGKAAIYCVNSPCTASSALISSKDNLTTPELNAPNTIDGCEDGTKGTYLQDESIENITITSLNNSFFQIGDTIQVDIWVYCSNTLGKLNFVYSNDADYPQWQVKDNTVCPAQGLQKLSTIFNLDNNIGQHAIRGVFGFNLQPNTKCGEDDTQNSDWTDTDDAVIRAAGCSIDDDCSPTECDHLDMCYSGTYRDYHDADNTCNPYFTCTQNECTSYNNIITDKDDDHYDTECEQDCNDNNPNINPGANEICDNGIDDDCDKDVDMDDPYCQGAFQLDLKDGWNLISLPKIEDENINEIIKLFNGKYEKIVALKQGIYYIYDKSDITNSNLDKLSEADGFWIEMNQDASILVDDEAASYASLDLIEGWNIIGYPSLEEKYVNELFADVMGDIELVYIYNPEFSSFNPKKPNNFLIKPGMGILIRIKDNAQWYFDGEYHMGQETFNLNLADGWNLISMPLTSDKTISDIFGSKKLYHLENNVWKEMDENDKINYSHAYWIKSSPESILITGNRISDMDYSINHGLNLINYPLKEEKGIELFFQNVINNIESVEAFENGEWKTFNPDKSAQLNSLNTLKPGIGIFVKAKNNANWHFDGDELT